MFEFSVDVLNYLAVVVAGQSVSADRPDFDEAAELLGRTRRELLAALAVCGGTPTEAVA